MEEEKDKIEKEISEDLKELVIARLDVFPKNKKISIGSEGDFTKKQLIEHIKKGDEIGEKIIEIQINFLKALKEGKLLEQINTSD